MHEHVALSSLSCRTNLLLTNVFIKVNNNDHLLSPAWSSHAFSSLSQRQTRVAAHTFVIKCNAQNHKSRLVGFFQFMGELEMLTLVSVPSLQLLHIPVKEHQITNDTN